MQKKKKILVSVTNDLVIDQRVHKVCMYLTENNFDVSLIGRKLSTSLPVSRIYKTKRISLLFNKGSLFYAFFNIRLFFYLLFNRCDVLLSNDLDTLPANYLVSKIKRCKLVYDSHEYFTEVPELLEKPKVKAFWENIEKVIFPKLKFVYTVNESLADVFATKYKVKVLSVRNLPFYKEVDNPIKNDVFTVIYQGALNKDRGLEGLILAFKEVENCHFKVIGSGDLESELHALVKKENLNSKITFLGKLPFEELRNHTLKAHLGVSLEKGTNLNYQLASPNKIFDYISAGIPVLTSNLPEIKKVVEKYDVGVCLENVDSQKIAEKITWMMSNQQQMEVWTKNARVAAKELCWENEKSTLNEIYLP